ncbi:uncharacterized protein [Rutidosis leptorrhynchoides]|uniref:uncharacterized protein n=1 Tax=Rutidosis leptorrhynchoides TaxID=125765 RepID=UPI003A99C2AF
MGCCASTNKPTPSPQFQMQSSKSSRAPPPVDEETVKEVLSETPNSNHFTKIENQPRKIKIPNQQSYNFDEIHVSGEVSEICSNVSETISTTTFEEDNEVFRRRVTDRSPAKLRNRQPVSGELRMLRSSPVKGKQQSPVRVRSGSGNEMNNRGPGLGSTGRQRPVPGNGPVGRSRSPANRTVARSGGRNGVVNGMGRSPSAKRRENSPGRVGAKLPERAMIPDYNSGYDRDEDGAWGPGQIDRNDAESLDNPLVSLECFIFL